MSNNKKLSNIKNVKATMAIENMFLSDEFVSKLVMVANGEKTSEELRKEVIRKYAR